jgi:hypothetical protein
MGRVFRVVLLLAFLVAMSGSTIGCRDSSAKKEHTPEEIEKAQQLGKDLGINMSEAKKPKLGKGK